MSPQFDQGFQDALDAPDPGLEPDEFTEAVHQALQDDAAPEAPPTEEPVEEEAEAPADAPVAEEPPPPPPQEPDYFDLAGIQIPRDKAEAVANFYAWSQTPEGQPWVRTLSELMERGIDPSRILQPEPPVAAAPPPVDLPPAEPEYFDPETSYRTLQTKVDEISSAFEAQRLMAQEMARQQSQTLLSSVSAEFAREHELTPQESAQLIDHMNRTTVLEGYKKLTDDGQVDTRATLLAAMEAAAWSIPDLKEKELARIQLEAKDRNKKDRKLAAVGGTSGSVPHKPQPTTPEERDAWAVEQISEAMGLAK